MEITTEELRENFPNQSENFYEIVQAIIKNLAEVILVMGAGKEGLVKYMPMFIRDLLLAVKKYSTDPMIYKNLVEKINEDQRNNFK